MITQKTINEIYKKHANRPESPDDLNIFLLFEGVHPDHEIMFEGNDIIINSVSPSSPFHRISLDKVNAIIEFEENVAIVLHSSIIFLSKKDNKVSIHIKQFKPSLKERISNFFTNGNLYAAAM